MKTKLIWGTRKHEGLKREIVAVVLPETTLNHIVAISSNRGSTEWGKLGDKGRGGLINDKKDPHRAERIGLLGEFALSALLQIPVDEESRKHGDSGWDFVLNNGSKVDTKCREKWYGNLLYNQTAYGTNNKKHEMHADYYVACYIRHVENKFAVVDIYGYQTKDFIASRPLQLAYNGYHWNREVGWDMLLDIRSLVELNKSHQII
jgi:hypothetical protein